MQCKCMEDAKRGYSVQENGLKLMTWLPHLLGIFCHAVDRSGLCRHTCVGWLQSSGEKLGWHTSLDAVELVMWTCTEDLRS